MPHDADRESRIEERARQLGLPTDPEAYQDGGLVPATTAYSVQEADLVAARLNSEGIPAWVEGGAMTSWNWHMTLGMHAGGVRILVPARRLADAAAVLAERGRGKDAPPGAAAVAAEEDPEDPAHPLYRRACGLACLLLVGPTYPVLMVLEVLLLRKMWRLRREHGVTPELRKAWRIALFSCAYLGLFLAVAVCVLGTMTIAVMTEPSQCGVPDGDTIHTSVILP
jgi:hypothetical protein